MQSKPSVKMYYALSAALVALVVPAGFWVMSLSAAENGARWYSSAQAHSGQLLYEANCQSCHGVNAAGSGGDWRQPLADGSYPPPPLNGTAHTWHHSLPQLLRTIKNGGKAFGGKMPAFAGQLSEEEMLAILAHVQSYWSDEIYAVWKKRTRQ